MARFAWTIFLGAFLLFQVQPILGRFILPWFGGGAGVWTVCMLFFQMALLAGYAYAHLLSKKVAPKQQMLVHLVMIALSLLFLPITPSADSWRSTGEADQATVRILILLTTHIGIPYLLLSSTGPLLQSWFERQFPGRSPYRLYSLSNLGSLLALLSYPFLFEPWLTLRTQGIAWSIAFAIYGLSCAWCAWRFHQSLATGAVVHSETTAAPTASPSHHDGTPEPSRGVQMTLWIALSAVGSIMLVSTTNQICQDLAVVPMLWVAPLAIYLITFIICFDADRWYHRGVWGPLLAVSILAVNYVMHNRQGMPMLWQVLGFGSALLTTCMVCHGELVRLRPNPSRLTAFYLSISAGGALGGAFVAIAAPLLFPDYWEYHVGLLVACLLAFVCMFRARGFSLTLPRRRLTLAVISLIWIALAVSLFAQAAERHLMDVVTRRNFYGVLHLREAHDPYHGSTRFLNHGQTTHGRQYMDIDRSRWATTYYGEDSGVGLAIDYAARPRQNGGVRTPIRIGAIGLGTGTIAALTEKGDYLRFYEINPQVEEFARTYFTYLKETPADVDVIIGDARLMLEREVATGKPQAFDVLAIDAFNSDSIPLHLLTSEAMDYYIKSVKPDTGMIAFHISNRYIDLTPVIHGLARSRGMEIIVLPSIEETARLGTSSATWIVLTKDKEFAKDYRVRVTAEFFDPASEPSLLWTDDFASLWSVMTRAGVAVSRWRMTPNGGRFIVDRADLITRKDEREIFYLQRHLFHDAHANFPVVVATVKGVTLNPDGSKPESFEKHASVMFRQLGLHNPKDDNAILLLISVDDRQFIVHLGAAWDKAANEEAHRIVNQIVLPGLQKGQSSPAIVAGMRALEQMARKEMARRKSLPPPGVVDPLR